MFLVTKGYQAKFVNQSNWVSNPNLVINPNLVTNPILVTHPNLATNLNLCVEWRAAWSHHLCRAVYDKGLMTDHSGHQSHWFGIQPCIQFCSKTESVFGVGDLLYGTHTCIGCNCVSTTTSGPPFKCMGCARYWAIGSDPSGAWHLLGHRPKAVQCQVAFGGRGAHFFWMGDTYLGTAHWIGGFLFHILIHLHPYPYSYPARDFIFPPDSPEVQMCFF